jgi:hypothetical protein
MLFGKNKIKCKACNSDIEKKFSFCPYCGLSLLDKQKEMRDFGMLGKDDNIPAANPAEKESLSQFGLSDKLINSIMNSVIKSMDKQMRNANPEDLMGMEGASVEQLPNGIKIKIGMPGAQSMSRPKPRQAPRKQITEAQLERMSKLPRQEAKSKIRRLSDRVVCELAVSGLASPDDVFISKLESGYEIKAIGKSKVYVNSIPISLPLRGFAFDDKTLSVEFKIQK